LLGKFGKLNSVTSDLEFLEFLTFRVWARYHQPSGIILPTLFSMMLEKEGLVFEQKRAEESHTDSPSLTRSLQWSRLFYDLPGDSVGNQEAMLFPPPLLCRIARSYHSQKGHN